MSEIHIFVSVTRSFLTLAKLCYSKLVGTPSTRGSKGSMPICTEAVQRLYRGCCSKRSCCCSRRLSNSAFTLLQGGSSWDRQLWSCQLAIRSQSGWNPLTDWRSFDFTLRGCSLSNGQMDTFNVIAWEYTCQGGYICRCY